MGVEPRSVTGVRLTMTDRGLSVMTCVALSGAATVAFCSEAAIAQQGSTLPDMTDVSPADVPPPELVGPARPDTTVASALTGEALAAYRSWTSERRRTYDDWPPEYRAYFWTLNANQQRAWWRFSPEQKAMVFGLTPGQRLTAWQVIEARMQATAPEPSRSGR
jgi:hypothetical protein